MISKRNRWKSYCIHILCNNVAAGCYSYPFLWYQCDVWFVLEVPMCLRILYTNHLNFQLGDTRIHFSQSPIQQENGTPKKQTVFFFLSSSSFQDFPFVFHVFSLKKVVVFFHHQNVGPFRALRTHHGGYITPPSAHRGGPPGRDVTTERASWISTVPTTTNKPPEVFGCYWMQLEDERVLLFCFFFFLCFLCLKVRFKCVVFF